MHPLASPRSGWPSGWPHNSNFINILQLAYISIILLACSKRVCTKMSKIKSEKNTTPCRTLNTVDPAKNGLKRTRIERDTLNFCPGRERALPAQRADWWDWWIFPFWERAWRLLAPRFTPFPSYLGLTQVSWGLALSYTNHSIVYLGFETTLGRFGEGLVTLTPGVVGWQNPLLLVLQVSSCLGYLYIYSTDIMEVNCAHLGQFLAGVDPSLREGVTIAKIAIPPERSARLFCPFGHIF